jgi:hypothetical protein
MKKFDLKIYNDARFHAEKISDFMKLAEIKSYYIAGGCFQKIVHDYDIFPVNVNDFDDLNVKLKEYIVFSSKNAITIKYNNLTLQFCKYYHNSLKSLVDSFDFAHTQIGTKIEHYTQPVEIYYSENYLDWKLTDEDVYTGTEYPLASLIRTFKYKENYLVANYKKIVIEILTDIVKRGFKDYSDFKDQLDAIDLGFITDNESHMSLFEVLRKDKND